PAAETDARLRVLDEAARLAAAAVEADVLLQLLPLDHARHRFPDRLAGKHGVSAEEALVRRHGEATREPLGERTRARRRQPLGGAEDEDVGALPVRTGEEEVARRGRLEAPREERERLGGTEAADLRA